MITTVVTLRHNDREETPKVCAVSEKMQHDVVISVHDDSFLDRAHLAHFAAAYVAGLQECR
jgi:hypothetical protein